ncbi:MAG: hypothetical protein HUU15_02245 [Candidatus Brocadiae bacterium]|nr:hypothetical protein [Candidatus Brocadiia bacterium]
MKIITNLWRAAVTCALAAALSMPVLAEDDEEFPEGPGVGQPAPDEELPDSDEEEMEEEEVDPLKTLEEIIGKMKDAESALSEANKWKATDAEGKVIEDLDDLLTAQDLQEKAIREMSKIFGGGKEGQQKAVDGIEKLIKAAKEQEGKGQESNKPKKEKKQKQPQNNQTKQPNNPATQPYNPNQNMEGGDPANRTGSLGDKWGNLPDKMREELSQADDEFRNARGQYKSRLIEYSKVIGSQD